MELYIETESYYERAYGEIHEHKKIDYVVISEDGQKQEYSGPVLSQDKLFYHVEKDCYLDVDMEYLQELSITIEVNLDNSEAKYRSWVFNNSGSAEQWLEKHATLVEE